MTRQDLENIAWARERARERLERASLGVTCAHCNGSGYCKCVTCAEPLVQFEWGPGRCQACDGTGNARVQ